MQNVYPARMECCSGGVLGVIPPLTGGNGARVGELCSLSAGFGCGLEVPTPAWPALLCPSHGRSGSDHFESHTVPMCLSSNKTLHQVQESSNALGNSYHFSLALHLISNCLWLKVMPRF